MISSIDNRIVRKSCVAALLAAFGSAHALGIVSRSCLPAGAQESVSVDWGFKDYVLWTSSEHYRDGALLHIINTVPNSPQTNGWENTWRSYAGHLGSEFWYGQVIGHHWQKGAGGIYIYMGDTTATDCNLSQWGAQN